MTRTDWRNGWLEGIAHIPSPNFGPRPEGGRIDLAVIHSISLPPGEYGGDEIERLFTNTLDWTAHPYFEQIRGLEVSAHFVIRRDGRIQQFVSVLDRAWHAGLPVGAAATTATTMRSASSWKGWRITPSTARSTTPSSICSPASTPSGPWPG